MSITKGNSFRERYSGERAVLGEALLNHDPFDQFAWVQGWRFAICDALLWDWGYLVPEFHTAASGPEDTYELEMIRTLYVIDEDDQIDRKYWHVEDELKYALKILDRYREWLRIAGEDY